MSKTETRTVKMTPEDIARAEIARDEAYAHIGAIAVTKAKANAEAAAQTKFQTKIVDALVANLEAGEHDVVCRVVLDYQDGKAHFYRQDTHVWQACRPMTDEERQRPIDYGEEPWSAVPEEKAAAAKKKSPGLKAQEKTEVSHGMANEPLVPVVLAPEVAAVIIAEAAAPDEVRAAVVEAGVPDSMVENAIGAIRNGADPATVIHNAKRAVKGEKPAKVSQPKAEKKGKGKKAPERTPEDQARTSLADELKELLGQQVGIAATFAIVDGLERAEAIVKGEAINALLKADPPLVTMCSHIIEDVFEEGLSVEDAAVNARQRLQKKGAAAEAAQ